MLKFAFSCVFKSCILESIKRHVPFPFCLLGRLPNIYIHIFVYCKLTFEFFHNNVSMNPLNLTTTKNCSHKYSIQGSLQLKASVLTTMLLEPSVIAIILMHILMHIILRTFSRAIILMHIASLCTIAFVGIA